MIKRQIALLWVLCFAGFGFAEAPQIAPVAPHCHGATLAETPHGLVAAWFAGKSGKDPDSKIYVSRLDQGSEAWTTPIAVASGMQNGRAVGAKNPVLFQLKNGPLLLFYKAGKNPRSWSGMLLDSPDGGKTWGQARPLPDGILGPTKNKPIELEDGTILCPSSTESRLSWKAVVEKIRPQALEDYFKKSRWSAAGPPRDPSLFAIQPALMDLGEDGILMLCRSKHINPFSLPSLLESRSHDGGHSWSKLKVTSLPNPNSGIDAVALADGRCLLVCNPTRKMRTPLSVALSKDGGQTWENAFTLEGGPGEYSYPSVIQSKDGRVHIVYTWRNKRIKYAVLDPKFF